jgi:hypothetical protein
VSNQKESLPLIAETLKLQEEKKSRLIDKDKHIIIPKAC